MEVDLAAPAGQWWQSGVWNRRKQLTISAASGNAVSAGYSAKYSCTGADAADIYNDRRVSLGGSSRTDLAEANKRDMDKP